MERNRSVPKSDICPSVARSAFRMAEKKQATRWADAVRYRPLKESIDAGARGCGVVESFVELEIYSSVGLEEERVEVGVCVEGGGK